VELEEGSYVYYGYLRSIGSAVLEVEYIGEVWLFHQTDRQCADGILRDRAMRPGWRGMFGAGIYFAADPRTTNTKAHRFGMMIKAHVTIGTALVLRQARIDFDPSCLPLLGFGGVKGCGGPDRPCEFIVYDSWRVTDITVTRWDPS
jgi:hypothetical protein